MKKKIGIIGAGISGLIFANLLKQNSKYDFTIYEKNTSLNLSDGYGVQLSVNSASILNEIGFKNFKNNNKCNPKKIDFYSLKNNNKICDLNISQFNSEDVRYTTLKRSSLIEFLKEKLLSDSIQFNKKIEKINYSNSKIEIIFKDNSLEAFDYLVISDGVFSSTKSTLFNKEIKPKYFGALAVRCTTKKENLKFLNENNIAIFLGPNIHLVAYPMDINNLFNLVIIARNKVDQNNLNNHSFFENKNNIKNFLEKSSIRANDSLKNIFNKAQDLKCFPIFISDKTRQPSQKNIFFLGDSLFALPPTFAQGASQSTESAYELFKILDEDNNDNFNKYYSNRIKRIKMVNQRSKLNYFIFHLSNPILVLVRNIVLKIVANNKKFLSKYLGQIYLKNN